MERPLRLNFAVNDERLEKVLDCGPFQALATSKKRKDTAGAEAEIAEGEKLQMKILKALLPLEGIGVVTNREKFASMVRDAVKRRGLKLPATLLKAILSALSERDETADICMDSDGNPEPDPELRDYENVPLKEDIQEYMEREVLPHVTDAWVDESKTKVGYEINFNRHFYRYTPPRPLEEIEADLRQIEAEIAGLLEEVAG